MATKRKTNRLKKYQEAGFVFDPKKLLPQGELPLTPPPPPPGVNPYTTPIKNNNLSPNMGAIAPKTSENNGDLNQRYSNPQFAATFDRSILNQMKEDKDPNLQKYKNWYGAKYAPDPPSPFSDWRNYPMYARTAASAIGTNIANNRQNEYLWRNLNNPYSGILPFNDGRSDVF